jgi:ABC-type glycerol-3-phosphate transport system permease component
MTTSSRFWLITLQILMTLILISFLLPTLWMVSSSLKVSTEIFKHPIVWIPQNPQWKNYLDVFERAPMDKYALNTLTVTVLAMTGTLVSSVLVAYSFSRINWPGRDMLFGVLLATMMLPEIVTLIPRFILFKNLGWTKPDYLFDVLPLNFLPLTVPYWFAGTPLYVFLMRQFFKGIPMELEEAARMDGANRLQILAQIILPLAKPVLATVAVFSFLQHYNDFLEPLIYLSGKDKWTLAVGLRALNDAFGGNWEIVFAAATLMLLPMLLLFIVAQRYFVAGIATTGFGGR